MIPDLFPETPGQMDVLGGMTDFTYGDAKAYFASLTDADREIVQWYSRQEITPPQAHGFVLDMVFGYDAVDPDRRAVEAIASAHEELQRIERYLELFLRSGDFFPAVGLVRRTMTDFAHGTIEQMEEEGWVHFGLDADVTDLDWHRDMTRKLMAPLLPDMHRFLDNPAALPQI